MLNQALRRTSGSNVHVTHASPCSAAHARWCSFIARPSPVRRTPGRTPVTWLCSDGCAEVAAEEPERAADDLLADVRPRRRSRRRARWRAAARTPTSGVVGPRPGRTASTRRRCVSSRIVDDAGSSHARRSPVHRRIAVTSIALRPASGTRSARPELGATAGRRRRRTPRGTVASVDSRTVKYIAGERAEEGGHAEQRVR